MANSNHSWKSTTTNTANAAMATTTSSLFSTIFTLYLLILLYFPHFLLKFIIPSPLLISTLLLLLSLLRFGAAQNHPINRLQDRPEPEPVSDNSDLGRAEFERLTVAEPDPGLVNCQCPDGPGSGNPGRAEVEQLTETEADPGRVNCQCQVESGLGHDTVHGPNPFCRMGFMVWDVSAPLEVIYEAHEGEEDGDERQNDAFLENNMCMMAMGLGRYPLLSRYYPESDSVSGTESSSTSSDGGDFPAIERWDNEEEEEEREGLIEIALCQGMKAMKIEDEVVQVIEEEDNLIEIDISPTTTNVGFSWREN